MRACSWAFVVVSIVGCASSEPEMGAPTHDAGSDGTIDSTTPETSSDSSTDGSRETAIDAASDADAAPETHPLKVESMVPGGGFHDGLLRLRSGALVAGLESGGIGYSPDGGKTWRMANVGLESPANLSIASIVEHPVTDGFLLIAAGNGEEGQVLLTEDIGDLRHHPWKVSWKGVGAHTFDGGGVHPRQTGHLFAFSTLHVYVSTGAHGVWRAPLAALTGVATWLRISDLIPDGEAHDLATDASGRLFVAMKGDAVYLSVSPGADPTIFVPLGGAGRCKHPVSLLPMVDRVYVACAHEGIRRFDIGVGFKIDEPWKDLTSAPVVGSSDPATGPYWKTLAGTVIGGKHVLFAGSELGQPALVRSDDARGDTVGWTSIGSIAATDPAMLFPESVGESWWFWDPALRFGDAAAATSGRLAAISELAFDATADRLFFAGNGGIAAVSHASSAPEIRPIGRAGGTRTLGLAIDPKEPKNVAAIEETLGLVQLNSEVPSEQSAAAGMRAIAADPIDSTLYIGGDSKKVLKKTFARDVAWTEVATLDDRIIGLSVGRSDGDTVVLAVTPSAVLRRVADGAFVDVTPSGFSPSADSVQIAWARGSKVVYLHDRAKGIHRSSDAGAHWEKLLDAKAEAGPDPTDFIAIDDTRPDRLWVVTTTTAGERALHRVVDDAGNDAAATGTAPKLVRVKDGPKKVSAITVDAAGTLYLVEAGSFARFWSYSDGKGFRELSNAADDPSALFAGAAARVRDLRVVSGAAYLAGIGAGIVRVTFEP
ncbi:MAG: hypothetical protein ACXVEF_27775 [Polyangiales bacterium]